MTWTSPKCGSPKYKVEELVLYGHYGVMGRAYRFNVYICENCKYSELYFKERTAIW